MIKNFTLKFSINLKSTIVWSTRMPNLTKIIIIIILRALVGSELIAHEAEGQIVYWLRGHDESRVVVLVKSNELVKKRLF